jgi:hypothetical protein
MKKKIYLLLLSFCFSILGVKAQTAYEYLDMNGLSARFNANGQLFWDGKKATFEAPKGSGSHSISAAGLWIGGIDKGGQLHLSAQTYGVSGTDFQPGPLDSAGNTTAALAANYNHVWKITRLEIDSFLAGLSTPKSILTWPGNNNSTGYAPRLAPFVDVDKDGIYNPAKGDYPDIKGDVMLWWVYNDQMLHTETKGLPLGVEVQASAYTYNCSNDPLLNNTIFLHYTIINRSASVYDSMFAGVWTDFDIGNPFNDYAGCDTALNTCFAYNADSIDADTTIITSNNDTIFYKGYGSKLPSQSLSFLDGFRNDKGLAMPVSKFMYFFNNDNKTMQGHPKDANNYYGYLIGQWLDGKPLTQRGTGYGGNIPANYAFPGDPYDGKSWSELAAKNKTGDRSMIGSYGPVVFNAGESKEITAAFTFNASSSGETRKSLAMMKDNAEQVEARYARQSFAPCSGISICSNADSCVWPGDANNDKVTEATDIFNIGYAYGAKGPKRPYASSAYIAQGGPGWRKSFPNGKDYKYADCNGDGVIDSLDVLPIILNYGEAHSKKGDMPMGKASDPLMSINIVEDSVPLGGIIHFQVKLGNGLIPAKDVMATAFDIDYTTGLLDSEGFAVNFNPGWIGNSGGVVGFAKNEGSNGKTHTGITSKARKTNGDSGIISTFKYVVSDNISGGFKKAIQHFNIAMATTVDTALNTHGVRLAGDSVIIYSPRTGIEEANALFKSINLYPNPTNEAIYIEVRGQEPKSLTIYSIYGTEIRRLDSSALSYHARTKIETNSMAGGAYFVKIQGEGSTVMKKFFIVK